MRRLHEKICVLDIHYGYQDDYYEVQSIIPQTEWIEVDDNEFLAITKATKNNKSALFNKVVIELIDVKPLIPKLKDELLLFIEKEKQEEDARRKKLDEEKEMRLEKKKQKELKQKAKLYQQLKAEFGETE